MADALDTMLGCRSDLRNGVGGHDGHLVTAVRGLVHGTAFAGELA